MAKVVVLNIDKDEIVTLNNVIDFALFETSGKWLPSGNDDSDFDNVSKGPNVYLSVPVCELITELPDTTIKVKAISKGYLKYTQE